MSISPIYFYLVEKQSFVAVLGRKHSMMKQEKGLRLATPAKYRIQIQGYLDNTWADQMGRMTFTNHLASGRAPVTVLTGRVLDQAELVGLLCHLYGLGFPLLSIECLEICE